MVHYDLVYSLPAIADMRACAALHSVLVEHLALQHHVGVDASGVERIATPGIQCLISARTSFRAAGKVFSVLNPSAAFTGALTIMQMEELLLIDGVQA